MDNQDHGEQVLVPAEEQVLQQHGEDFLGDYQRNQQEMSGDCHIGLFS